MKKSRIGILLVVGTLALGLVACGWISASAVQLLTITDVKYTVFPPEEGVSPLEASAADDLATAKHVVRVSARVQIAEVDVEKDKITKSVTSADLPSSEIEVEFFYQGLQGEAIGRIATASVLPDAVPTWAAVVWEISPYVPHGGYTFIARLKANNELVKVASSDELKILDVGRFVLQDRGSGLNPAICMREVGDLTAVGEIKFVNLGTETIAAETDPLTYELAFSTSLAEPNFHAAGHVVDSGDLRNGGSEVVPPDDADEGPFQYGSWTDVEAGEKESIDIWLEDDYISDLMSPLVDALGLRLGTSGDFQLRIRIDNKEDPEKEPLDIVLPSSLSTFHLYTDVEPWIYPEAAQCDVESEASDAAESQPACKTAGLTGTPYGVAAQVKSNLERLKRARVFMTAGDALYVLSNGGTIDSTWCQTPTLADSAVRLSPPGVSHAPDGNAVVVASDFVKTLFAFQDVSDATTSGLYLGSSSSAFWWDDGSYTIGDAAWLTAPSVLENEDGTIAAVIVASDKGVHYINENGQQWMLAQTGIQQNTPPVVISKSGGIDPSVIVFVAQLAANDVKLFVATTEAPEKATDPKTFGNSVSVSKPTTPLYWSVLSKDTNGDSIDPRIVVYFGTEEGIQIPVIRKDGAGYRIDREIKLLDQVSNIGANRVVTMAAAGTDARHEVFAGAKMGQVYRMTVTADQIVRHDAFTSSQPYTSSTTQVDGDLSDVPLQTLSSEDGEPLAVFLVDEKGTLYGLEVADLDGDGRVFEPLSLLIWETEPSVFKCTGPFASLSLAAVEHWTWTKSDKQVRLFAGSTAGVLQVYDLSQFTMDSVGVGQADAETIPGG